MNSQTNLITTEQYFDILSQESLKPEEIIQKVSYEKFISMCRQYDGLISPAAQSILNEYNSRVMTIGTKETKTSHEESILNDFQSAFKNNEENLSQEGPTRTLAKAGYINATIILAILLNVGFVIAMAMLGS